MRITKNKFKRVQSQEEGSIALVILYFIVIGVLFLGFVTEAGRMIMLSQRVQYAATMGAHAAAITYRKTLKDQLDDLAKSGRDLKLVVLTTQESDDIKSKARDTAVQKADQLMKDNGVVSLGTMPSSDSLSWTAYAKATYDPVFLNVVPAKFEIKRHATFFY